MSEAIFSKYSKGGDVKIDNNTKIALGVNNDASLDDCLMAIGRGSGMDLIDPYNVPFTATVFHPNSSPVISSPVSVRFPNGTTKTYTTDRNGDVKFSSPPGGVWINDANCNYFDLQPNNRYVTCSIGQNWNNLTLMRTKTFTNGGSYTFTYNTNIRFSEFINRYDVECKGGDGQGGTSTVFVYACLYAFSSPGNNNGWYIDNSNSRYNNSQTWQIYVGWAYNNKINFKASCSYPNSMGSNGYFGNINIKKNLTTTGNIQIIIGERAKDRNYVYTKDLTPSVNNFTLWAYEGTSIGQFNGNTGGTTSFGSLVSASGGAGGIAGRYFNINSERYNYSNTIIFHNGPPTSGISIDLKRTALNISNNYVKITVNMHYHQSENNLNNGYVKLTNIYYK